MSSNPFKPVDEVITAIVQFTLPEGYRAWCHRCGRPPFNKTTDGIPGVGFKTLEESVKHDKEVHDYRKG